MSPDKQDLNLWDIQVGEIACAHGIVGEVKVLPTTDNEQRFDPGSRVCLLDVEGQRSLVTIAARRWHRRYLLLKLAEHDTRSAAERLRGGRLFIRADMMPPLPEGRYYVKDLIGMAVVTTDGRALGDVEDVLETGSNEVYVTQRALIPATRDVVASVDITHRRIVVRAIPGLLDEEDMSCLEGVGGRASHAL